MRSRRRGERGALPLPSCAARTAFTASARAWGGRRRAQRPAPREARHYRCLRRVGPLGLRARGGGAGALRPPPPLLEVAVVSHRLGRRRSRHRHGRKKADGAGEVLGCKGEERDIMRRKRKIIKKYG